MFAGLDKLHNQAIPNQAFADPYVFGFLQQLCIFATFEVYGGPKPPEVLARIASDAFDILIPGYGLKIIRSAEGIANPSHPMNINFTVGCREGKAYVQALSANDLVAQHEVISSFREFIVRNYMIG